MNANAQKRKYKRWALDEAACEALKFNTRFEFQKHSNNAYMWLRRNGHLESCCAHMEDVPFQYAGVWTLASSFAEAGKFATRYEFSKSSAGAYYYLKRHGVLEPACSHMKDKMTIFESRALALKFSTRSEFVAEENYAYNYARELGLLDAICDHMPKQRRWTKEAVIDAASKYTSLDQFATELNAAYRHALLFGYIDEACGHMPRPTRGFSSDKPASLYYLKVETPDGVALFKIGITNRRVKNRVMNLGRNGCSIHILHTIQFKSGREARLLEKQLHKEFSAFRYQGPPILGNGNTELFTRDVLAECYQEPRHAQNPLHHPHRHEPHQRH